jgi:hypothetical protein
MAVSGHSKETLLSITGDGAEANFHNAAFVVVEVHDDTMYLVPIHSNLPVEMPIKVPITSNCAFGLIYQGYYMDQYPKRWAQIVKQYPEVAKIGR